MSALFRAVLKLCAERDPSFQEEWEKIDFKVRHWRGTGGMITARHNGKEVMLILEATLPLDYWSRRDVMKRAPEIKG